MIFAHSSFRLRNMKNKLENKIEGAGLKRSPMGIVLEALGQQEENFQKIQSFLEGKLKEWSDFMHTAKDLDFFLLDFSFAHLSVNLQKLFSYTVCSPVCVLNRKLVIWRALSPPQGICHSTQNLSGHFFFHSDESSSHLCYAMCSWAAQLQTAS